MPKSSVDQTEALQDLIRETQLQCAKDGRALCSYFLELASKALEEENDELDGLIHRKFAPKSIKQAQSDR